MSSMINDIHFSLLAAAETGGGGHDAEKVFAPFDASSFPSQLFWFFLTFIVLYVLLWKVLLPRVGETIEERGSRIADDLDLASRMQREAEEAEKKYTQALADARAKAMNVAETTKQSIDSEVQTELAAADAEADKASQAAETRIRKVQTEALENVETIAAEAAQSVVATLTGKTVTMATIKSALT